MQGAVTPRHIAVWLCDVSPDFYENCGSAKAVMSAVDNEGTSATMEAGCKLVLVD